MNGPLRERDATEALLAAEIERARSGTGRLVLLRGATGTGRTTALETAARHAADRGLRVLRVHCSPEDTTVPFAMVHHLLDPFPEFTDTAPAGDGRGGAARLWRLLRSHAAEGPVLVAVDDVHLADAPSRRWLTEAARHVDRLPVLLVATERSQYDIDPPPPGLARALSPSLVRTHALAPLGDPAAAELVRGAFPQAPPRWTRECVRAGAGSPLLLHALLDDLAGTPHPDGTPPLPESCAALYPGSYPAAVSWWLGNAGPATAEVARCLAALEQARPASPPPRPGAPEGARPGPWTNPSPAGPTHRHAHETPTATPHAARPSRRRAEHRDDALPGHLRHRHPAEPADGTPHHPSHGPRGAYAPFAPDPSHPAHAPHDAAPGIRSGAAAYGRTDPPAPAPHRSSPWCTPPPPPERSPAEDLAAVLAEAAGADPVRIEGWLTAMTRLGLLRPDPDGRPRYAHPLLRDAVLSGWPRARREAAHLAAAEAMLRRGDRVEAVARHLLRTPAVGRPWTLRVLRDAVTVAVHDARPADAVGYLRRALDEPLTDGLRQRLLTELGSLEYASAGAPSAIARLAEAQHLPADPRNRVRTAVALGTALAGSGEIRTAMEVLRHTEGRLSGHPDLARTVQTATALLSDQDLVTRQEVYRWLCETGTQSPELVGPAGEMLLVRYAATAALISADEAMSRVRNLLAQPTDPLAEPFLLGTAAAVAQWADELDAAERLVERGLAGQHPALLHPMLGALVNTRVDIVAARGDLARLLALTATPGAGHGPGPGPDPTNGDAHTLMALVHTGRTDAALDHADRFDLREVPENWELNRYLYARGVLRAATGDPAGALHDFLESGRRQAAREVISPVVTPWRTAVAQCRL
ncbi:AAA family ATPase, partial [Streptomyces sp. NPDC002454]